MKQQLWASLLYVFTVWQQQCFATAAYFLPVPDRCHNSHHTLSVIYRSKSCSYTVLCTFLPVTYVCVCVIADALCAHYLFLQILYVEYNPHVQHVCACHYSENLKLKAKWLHSHNYWTEHHGRLTAGPCWLVWALVFCLHSPLQAGDARWASSRPKWKTMTHRLRGELSACTKWEKWSSKTRGRTTFERLMCHEWM